MIKTILKLLAPQCPANGLSIPDHLLLPPKSIGSIRLLTPSLIMPSMSAVIIDIYTVLHQHADLVLGLASPSFVKNALLNMIKPYFETTPSFMVRICYLLLCITDSFSVPIEGKC